MAIEIPADLLPELVPLSWLLGEWAGLGRIEYGDNEQREFSQMVVFRHNGGSFLEYRAESYLLDGEGRQVRPLHVELGFWQLEREYGDADGGVGMLPSAEKSALANAEEVERLRLKNEECGDNGFPLSVNILQPGGISETYVGTVDGPQLRLATDAVIRAKGAKEYVAATRMYGLVQGELMWAWDIAAYGRDLETHAAARLKNIESREP